ncbi:hypothetical protein GCM10017788_28690 [Amycolatopsis acidiphila]|nr:hypothetical protein GCM10017788_28690 [Amycolatopsis acidiphila]
MTHLLSFAATFLGPPLTYLLLLVLRHRLTARRQPELGDDHLTVADLRARLAVDRATSKPPALRARQCTEPPAVGRQWPHLDPDAAAPRRSLGLGEQEIHGTARSRSNKTHLPLN